MNSFCKTVLVLVLLFLSFNTLAEKKQKFLFKAKISDLAFKYTHIQLGRDNNETYQATLPGYVYLPARTINTVDRNNVNRSTPYLATISEFSSWLNSDEKWIVENFVPEEQEMIKNYLLNKKVLKQNRELYASRRSTEIWGVMYYEDYALVMISNNQQKQLGRTLSFKKVKGEWKRTHELADNLVVDLVNNAFRRDQYRVQ